MLYNVKKTKISEIMVIFGLFGAKQKLLRHPNSLTIENKERYFRRTYGYGYNY